MKYFFCGLCLKFANWLKNILIPEICNRLKIQKNKVVFYERFKCGYDCNPKYIAQEILKRKLPCKLIWITGNPKALKAKYPKQIKVIYHHNMFRVLYELATASVWITNFDFNHYFNWGLPKKNEQLYINTWHGSLGIKKVKTFINKNKNSYKINEIKNQFGLVDVFISNSSFETNVYKNAFLFDKTICEFGHPRNDIFFESYLTTSEKNRILKKVRKYKNIPEEKSIVLYAPSFRDDFRTDCFNMDYDVLLDALNSRFQKDFVLALRLHPNMAIQKKNSMKKSDRIFDYTDFDDIQELMYACDVLITDYSSCIFDFMLSRKPAFIYASDIEQYNNERGFFYPLETTPFPIAKNNKEIKERIVDFDINMYHQNVEKFLHEKGCIEDGLASFRTVNLIEEHIKNFDKQN